jgi:hypothetical protein
LGFQLGAVARRHQGDGTKSPAHPAHPVFGVINTGQTVRNVFELLGVVLQVHGDNFHAEELQASRAKN